MFEFDHFFLIICLLKFFIFKILISNTPPKHENVASCCVTPSDWELKNLMNELILKINFLHKAHCDCIMFLFFLSSGWLLISIFQLYVLICIIFFWSVSSVFLDIYSLRAITYLLIYWILRLVCAYRLSFQSVFLSKSFRMKLYWLEILALANCFTGTGRQK